MTLSETHDVRIEGDVRSVLLTAAQLVRDELVQRLAQDTKNIVQSGLFRDMKLPETCCWGDGDRAAKILGCYEAELHGILYQVMHAIPVNRPEVIANVGCAEGYYAVGLAREMPTTPVIAVDTDMRAQDITREAGRVNDVHNLVVSVSRFDLSSVIAGRRAFILMDCEGAELGYLNPSRVPELRQAEILVECHDFLDRSITPTLRSRFGETHEIEQIEEGARDPNVEWALNLSSLERWLLVSENRPEAMHWLHMVPRW